MSDRAFRSVTPQASSPFPANRTSPAPPLPVGALAGEIFNQLGQAIQGASVKLADAMQRSGKFRGRGDIYPLMALIRQLPAILPLLEKYPPPANPNARFIPSCPVCGAMAGEHWAHDCPQVHRDGKDHAVYDYRRKRILQYKEMDDTRLLDPNDYGPAQIPRCGVCGKGPGAHWPDACPDNPIRDRMRYDKVVPPSDQPANETEHRRYADETGVWPNDRPPERIQTR